MSKKVKLTPEQILLKEEEYLAFLRKQIDSSNYRMAVSEQEYKKTKEKYDKQKLKIKFLKDVR